jgi:hypothetical protein
MEEEEVVSAFWFSGILVGKRFMNHETVTFKLYNFIKICPNDPMVQSGHASSSIKVRQAGNQASE